MNFCVFRRCSQFQVFNSIVKFIMVNMMNNFQFSKFSSNMLFHNFSMKSNVFIVSGNSMISKLYSTVCKIAVVFSSIKRMITTSGTELIFTGIVSGLNNTNYLFTFCTFANRESSVLFGTSISAKFIHISFSNRASIENVFAIYANSRIKIIMSKFEDIIKHCLKFHSDDDCIINGGGFQLQTTMF